MGIRLRLTVPSFPIWLVLSARALLSLLGIALVIAGRVPTTADVPLRPYFGVAPVVEGLPGMLLGVWQRFDVIHYLRIASAGYSAMDLSVYFPLYPLLVRALGLPLGRNYLLAGLVVSTSAAVLAALVFYKLALDETEDVKTARRATAYLVFFPTAFFLLAPYPESLALLCFLVGFREARHGRWLNAGAAGLACSLVRPQGVLIVLVFVAEAVRQLRSGTRLSVPLVFAATAPALGALGFLGWRAAVGFPPLSTVLLTYWQRVTTFPLGVLPAAIARILSRQAVPIEYMDLIVVGIMIALGVLVSRRLPLPYAVYYWSVLLFNLSQLRLAQPLSSQARYALILFPAFIVLGQLGASPLVNRLILYPSMAVWLFLAGQFMMWGWVG